MSNDQPTVDNVLIPNSADGQLNIPKTVTTTMVNPAAIVENGSHQSFPSEVDAVSSDPKLLFLIYELM